MAKDSTFEYALRLGDNCLVLGQQVSAWCGHAPILEEDIALANVALDLIGQARLWLSYAAERENVGRDEDKLAFLRDVRDFRNCILVEQPNGDFGQTLMRQFLFDAWHVPMLTALVSSTDARIAEIAAKSVKEATYHLDRSHDLVVRLGDGTQESHDRMQNALDLLWPYTGELFIADELDDEMAEAGIGPDLDKIGEQYKDYLAATLKEGSLTTPADSYMHRGGKVGVHSENLGHLLSEMQFLQRAYPDLKW